MNSTHPSLRVAHSKLDDSPDSNIVRLGKAVVACIAVGAVGVVLILAAATAAVLALVLWVAATKLLAWA